MTGTLAGPDGLQRCGWALSAPEYIAYHDTEWGRPVHGEAALYERLVLEAFQSGLSWLTILRKREGFRRAFARFDVAAVADFREPDVERLLSDTGIVRNRAKVLAAITNARAVIALRDVVDGGLDALIWGSRPDPAERRPPRSLADVPAVTPESTTLARDLKRRGFVFVGPTTAYATMQACGVVNDHLEGCCARAAAAAR